MNEDFNVLRMSVLYVYVCVCVCTCGRSYYVSQSTGSLCNGSQTAQVHYFHQHLTLFHKHILLLDLSLNTVGTHCCRQTHIRLKCSQSTIDFVHNVAARLVIHQPKAARAMQLLIMKSETLMLPSESASSNHLCSRLLNISDNTSSHNTSNCLTSTSYAPLHLIFLHLLTDSSLIFTPRSPTALKI